MFCAILLCFCFFKSFVDFDNISANLNKSLTFIETSPSMSVILKIFIAYFFIRFVYNDIKYVFFSISLYMYSPNSMFSPILIYTS